jgi:3-oxoacyl-[acyl-carrier protein] reductase
MDMQLERRVALITGASRGIGRSIAAALAAEGTKLTLCARSSSGLHKVADELRQRSNAEVLVHAADVAQPGAIEQAVRATVERWGRLDILINSAGGPAPGTFDMFEDQDWQAAVDLTLMSVVRAVRAALPYLKESGRGRVINVLSTSIKQPLDGMLFSNSLRSAVAGLAKTLSRELGPHAITVNNVCPAHVLTSRLREVASAQAAVRGERLDPRAAVAALPMRRLGAPAEVADLVAFLASGRAAYISGTSIPIDGGATTSLT